MQYLYLFTVLVDVLCRFTQFKYEKKISILNILNIHIFFLNRAWLGQNSMSIETSFTKLRINVLNISPEISIVPHGIRNLYFLNVKAVNKVRNKIRHLELRIANKCCQSFPIKSYIYVFLDSL
jgi:hypothetical protein